MDIYSVSDKRIAQEWGGYIKSLRLQKNRTQKNIAEATRLSLNVIKALELGAAKLSTLIAVLRELEALESLNNMIGQPMISPLQRARMQRKERQRASGGHLKGKPSSGGKSEW